MLVLVVCCLSSIAYAGVTLPFSFTAGSPVSASQINANFGSLNAASWSLSSSNLYYTAGSVGIGSSAPGAMLDVGGSIRPGSSSVTCSGATEGLLRYNSTYHIVEFCNGTAWTSMSPIKAYGTYVSGSLTASMNVASVTNPQTGYFLVTLTNALPNANYVVLASSQLDANPCCGHDTNEAHCTLAKGAAFTTTQFKISCHALYPTLVGNYINPLLIYFVVISQ